MSKSTVLSSFEGKSKDGVGLWELFNCCVEMSMTLLQKKYKVRFESGNIREFLQFIGSNGEEHLTECIKEINKVKTEVVIGNEEFFGNLEEFLMLSDENSMDDSNEDLKEAMGKMMELSKKIKTNKTVEKNLKVTHLLDTVDGNKNYQTLNFVCSEWEKVDLEKREITEKEKEKNLKREMVGKRWNDIKSRSLHRRPIVVYGPKARVKKKD